LIFSESKMSVNMEEVGKTIQRKTKETAIKLKSKIIMPDEEKIKLSEWEKFKKYYRIPWFIILDTTLLICVLIMVNLFQTKFSVFHLLSSKKHLL
jgi:hypothetical protein